MKCVSVIVCFTKPKISSSSTIVSLRNMRARKQLLLLAAVIGSCALIFRVTTLHDSFYSAKVKISRETVIRTWSSSASKLSNVAKSSIPTIPHGLSPKFTKQIIEFHKQTRSLCQNVSEHWPFDGTPEEKFIAANCHACGGLDTWPDNGSAEDMYGAAMCGVDYEHDYFGISRANGRTRVLIRNFNTLNMDMSGCGSVIKSGGACPLIDSCEVMKVEAGRSFLDLLQKRKEGVRDVVLVSGMGLNEVDLVDRDEAKYVLYLREAYWKAGVSYIEKFDYVMGFQSTYTDKLHLQNPLFLRRPLSLQHVYPQPTFVERRRFAMSAVSHCTSRNAFRSKYIEKLEHLLGSKRVHRYGDCGTRALPKDGTLIRLVEIVRRYKFYFSFENSVRDGYVTEKLFEMLTIGPIPVYLGAPDVLRITVRKSFINALDFPKPSHLADYLVYLSKNETAYMEYHRWREEGAAAFTPEYLKQVSRHVPGKGLLHAPDDIPSYKQSTQKMRILACCKLCSLPYMSREPGTVKASTIWSNERVNRALYNISKPSSS